MPAALSTSNPFFRNAEQRVALARERFFHEGERPRGLVSDSVIRSWERCLGGGLMPQLRPEFEPVSRQRTRRAIDRNRLLQQAALPECEQLESRLSGTHCKALLTDRDGIVVHATASAGAAGPLLETAGRVGVFLGESNFGSTAPGIATQGQEACTVSGGEHFFTLLQPMHCAAAPIHDRSGRLLGALDLSVEGRAFGFDALTLVRLTASAIEQRLFVAQSQRQTVLRLQLAAGLLESPLAALIAFDEDGRVTALNGSAMQLLQVEPRHAPLDLRELLGIGAGALHDATRPGRTQALALRCGLKVFACIEPPRAPGPMPEPQVDAPAGLQPQPPTALQPPSPAPHAQAAESSADQDLRRARDHLIADALRRHRHNVSRAARELGVSRGLVYRHLQRRGG